MLRSYASLRNEKEMCGQATSPLCLQKLVYPHSNRYKFSGQLSRFVKSCVNATKTQKLEAMKTQVENDTGCYEDPELGGSCTQVLDYSKSKH